MVHTFSDVYLKFGGSFFLRAASNFGAKIQIDVKQKTMKTAKVFRQFPFVKMLSSRIFSDSYNTRAGMKNI